MKQILNIGILAAVATLALAATRNASAQDEQAKAEQAVASFKSTDPTLTNFFDKAAGYVIFPSVGEGGFIVGAEHGRGLLFEKGKATGKLSLTLVDIGAQVGGAAFSEVIFLQNAAALKNIKQSKYEMSAQAKATVAASGAAANAKYDQGVAVFTLPKSGVMVAAAIGGQKFKFEPLK